MTCDNCIEYVLHRETHQGWKIVSSFIFFYYYYSPHNICGANYLNFYIYIYICVCVCVCVYCHSKFY